MNKQTEEAIRLLTSLARGDVALVQSALLKHERDGVDRVINYIKSKRKMREKAREAEPAS